MNSMTGFGRARCSLGPRAYRVELRSFNNRFLDLKLRQPWINSELEALLLGLLRGQLSRGRVELAVLEEPATKAAGQLALDESVARDLAGILARMAELLGCDLSTAARLIQPPRELVVAATGPQETQELWQALEPAAREAVAGLQQMRQREGAALAQDLQSQLDELTTRQARIAELAQGEPTRQQERLAERLRQLTGETSQLDPGRIASEVAILADRCDINEELTRISSHVQQLRGILAQAGEVGRKIEFMLQELNRELNTVASKSLSAEIAQLVVECKAALEKMREQAQNVE